MWLVGWLEGMNAGKQLGRRDNCLRCSRRRSWREQGWCGRGWSPPPPSPPGSAKRGTSGWNGKRRLDKGDELGKQKQGRAVWGQSRSPSPSSSPPGEWSGKGENCLQWWRKPSVHWQGEGWEGRLFPLLLSPSASPLKGTSALKEQRSFDMEEGLGEQRQAQGTRGESRSSSPPSSPRLGRPRGWVGWGCGTCTSPTLPHPPPRPPYRCQSCQSPTWKFIRTGDGKDSHLTATTPLLMSRFPTVPSSCPWMIKHSNKKSLGGLII